MKRYVGETGSITVRRLLASSIAGTSRLSEVEVSSAIIRRAREGAFALKQRDRMLAALQHDVPALAIVELSSEITADARALLLRHPVRAGDAVQLASCVYLQRQLGKSVPFVAFDGRLVAAARAEGLTVIGGRGDGKHKVMKAIGILKRAGTGNAPTPGDELPLSTRRPRHSARQQKAPNR